MSDIVIRVEGLSKRYIIGHQAPSRERYTALRDVVSRNIRSIGRSARDVLRGHHIVSGDNVEEFWAIRDVSLDIKRGEVVGVIGRNGAGKSTLLKILSRITEPSEGRVTIKGRVASLLEVGTGFHPELTGRENIYLNGAILGMTRAEIKRNFDEIVAFAEIARFLDTPVKRYSSGMYVRLAFAVAAHLEPEILVVDEVLAVGDFEFQKKCLGKMQDISASGRTVLFVSHNLAALKRICPSSILLDQGRLVKSGVTEQIINQMLTNTSASSSYGGSRFTIKSQVERCTLLDRQAWSIKSEIEIKGPLEEPHFGIGISDEHGNRVATVLSDSYITLPSLKTDELLKMCIETEPVRLAPGTYQIKAVLSDHVTNVEVRDDAVRLLIPEYSPFQTSRALVARPTGALILPIQRMDFHKCNVA